MLSNEPDFLAQLPWLAEEVQRFPGFSIMFYPKYHRNNCTYSYGLTRTLEARIPLSFVRRTAKHCLRYMDAYRAGLEGSLLDFVVKKYKSHRSVTPEQAAEIKLAFEEWTLKQMNEAN